MSAVQPHRLTSALDLALAHTRQALERAGTPAIGNQPSDATVRAGQQVKSPRSVGSAIGTERGRPVIGRVPLSGVRRSARTLTRSFVHPTSKFTCEVLHRDSLVISSEFGDLLHNLRGELLQEILDYSGRSQVTYIGDLVGNVPVNSIHEFLERPDGQYDRIVVLRSGELIGVRPGSDLPQIDGNPVLVTFRRHDVSDPAPVEADDYGAAAGDDVLQNAAEADGAEQGAAPTGSRPSMSPASNPLDPAVVADLPPVSDVSSISDTASDLSPISVPTQPDLLEQDTGSVRSEDSASTSEISVHTSEAARLADPANPPLPARAAAVRRQIAELRERHGRGAQTLRANTPLVRHDQFNERADAFDQAMATLADIADQHGDDPDVITILENGLTELSRIEGNIAQQIAESITRSAQNIVSSFGSGVLDTASRRMK